MKEFLGGRVRLYPGDCLEVLRDLPESSVDSVVTDPPYHLNSIVQRFGADGAAPAKSNGATGVYARASSGFMGKRWDGGDLAFRPETWAAVLRVLKPGGHLLAFAAPRNQHRMICSIEDAGFEIRDCLQWMFGQGFPKSHNAERGVATITCKLPGRHFEGALPSAEKRRPGDHICPMTPESQSWKGWGTALKPAHEPICLARKPLVGTIAANVLAHGTGALNIHGCRVATGENLNGGAYAQNGGRKESPSLHGGSGMNVAGKTVGKEFEQPKGRWPANIIHDGSNEVVGRFPDAGGGYGTENRAAGTGIYGAFSGATQGRSVGFGDSGSAARFFYTAKADADDRAGSKHPTVKPLDLMQYLVRLVTPPGGTVLDPFAGSGTTGEAAWREGFSAVLIEREADSAADIERRMEWATMGPESRANARAKLLQEREAKPEEPLPLFADLSN